MGLKDKEEKKAYQRKWYQAHKEKVLAHVRAYASTHREVKNINGKIYRTFNHDKIYKQQKAWYTANRIAVFSNYGGKCQCCGENEPKFLAIDHINGGGCKHRKELGVEGSRFYRWLIKNNFPDGFQILCHNCNMAKGFYGICPHRKEDN